MQRIHSGWLAISLAFGVLSAGAPMLRGEEPQPGAASETDKRESAARLARMRSRALSLTVDVETGGGVDRAEIVEAPLLRYGNPAAEIVTLDATVWAWGRVGRPAVLASVEDSGCELVALTERPLVLRGRSAVKWKSPGSEIEWKPVPDAPPPAERAPARARQMKSLIQRFAATGHYGAGNENLELRLMDRYLHRYAHPEDGLLDGAIYAFSAGTNPEVLVLLECRESSKNDRRWHYGCARFSAGALEARLDESVVWTCPAIARWGETAPYSVAAFDAQDVAAEGGAGANNP